MEDARGGATSNAKVFETGLCLVCMSKPDWTRGPGKDEMGEGSSA